MSDKKKSRAFVFEHQGYRVPATSSKKSKKKKKTARSFTKLTKRTRTTHKQKHTEQTMVACSKKQQTSEKRNSKESTSCEKISQLAKQDKSLFFCSTYKKQAPRKHDRMTEKDVPTLIHWRKLPNNRKTCSSDCQLSLRGKIPCVP